MIVVLENGEIQATGAHDELLKKSEIYARLCELQFTTTG
jgi:ATP-binding cassette subfamily B protein